MWSTHWTFTWRPRTHFFRTSTTGIVHSSGIKDMQIHSLNWKCTYKLAYCVYKCHQKNIQLSTEIHGTLRTSCNRHQVPSLLEDVHDHAGSVAEMNTSDRPRLRGRTSNPSLCKWRWVKVWNFTPNSHKFYTGPSLSSQSLSLASRNISNVIFQKYFCL